MRSTSTLEPSRNIGFSSRPRQQTNASRAPGSQARRMLPNAAAGSAKNITPKRDVAAV